MAINKSKSPRRKKSKERFLLTDIALMACIHYAFFLVYAFIWSSGSNTHHGGHNNSAIRRANVNSSFMSQASPNTSIKNRNESSTEDNHQRYIKYEPGYPKISRTHYFPTRATEKEMAKHDRYLVHGILYTDMLNDDYIGKHWNITKINDHLRSNSSSNNNNAKKVCMNILMKNRSQPYINALVMSLMMSHEDDESANSDLEEEEIKMINEYGKGHQLLSYVELNLFDTERRSDYMEYDRQRQKILSLPFLNVHRPYSSNDAKSKQGNDVKQKNFMKRLNKIDDYLHAAKQCVQSNLQYCLIMEEYTIVPINFLQSLKDFVISTIEEEKLMDGGENNDSHMSMLSLFSVLDTKTQSIMKIHDVNYSREWYDYHRGKLNSERKSMEMEEYEAEYELFVDSDGVIDGGYNTAMLFLMSTVEKKLIPMLESMKHRGKISRSVNDDSSKQHFDLEKEFATYSKSKIYQLVPSLINRIGFYDEDYGDAAFDSEDERLGISNWLTDPRFIFEAGSYWEGRDMYCMKPDGEWIEDEYYNDDSKSSCKS